MYFFRCTLFPGVNALGRPNQEMLLDKYTVGAKGKTC